MYNETTKKAIGRIASRVSQFYPAIPHADLVQEGWLIAAKAWQTWDAERAEWSVHLGHSLWGHLRHYARWYTKHHQGEDAPLDLSLCTVHQDDEYDEEPTVEIYDTSVPHPASRLVFQEDLRELDNDAEYVYSITCRQPAEGIVQKDGQFVGWKKARGNLRSHLRAKGWSYPRLRRALNKLNKVAAKV